MPVEKVEAIIGRLSRGLKRVETTSTKRYDTLLQKYDELQELVSELTEQLQKRGQSTRDYVNTLPGRHIWYNMNAHQTFTASDAGKRGSPMPFSVSQDGLFVMTHYPLPVWRVSKPDDSARFGFWRPCSHWPLADQVEDKDIIDLSYEFDDGGSDRNFQNEPSPPLFSRPDNLIELPDWTLFTPNSTMKFTPTYEAIHFTENRGRDKVQTTEGELIVTLPGFKIANL